MSSNDETKVSNFLQRYGLNPIRFNKEELRTLGKTPDFKVFNEGALAAFCEVKSIMGDDFNGCRDDPTYNGMQNRIHESFKQFRSVNADHKIPNVLALVNRQASTDIIDLYSVLTGDFYCDNGEKVPLFRKYSHGRILSEKTDIDLFIWFQRDTAPRFSFNLNSMFFQILCELFNTKPEQVKTI